MKSAALLELVVGILILVGGALACAWFGYDIAKNRSAKKIANLRAEVGVLNGSLDLAESVNQGNASQLTSLRKTLKDELGRKQQIEQANQAELAKHADRIAQLEQAADQRLDSITRKANEDEDCAPLRDLPVCAAVAERLWGSAATARPH